MNRLLLKVFKLLEISNIDWKKKLEHWKFNGKNGKRKKISNLNL